LGPSDSTHLLLLRQNRGGTGELKGFLLTDGCSFQIIEWDQNLYIYSGPTRYGYGLLWHCSPALWLWPPVALQPSAMAMASCGSAAQRYGYGLLWHCSPALWLWPPVALQPSAGYGLLESRGFLVTHNDTPHSVGLLWTSDQLVAETST
jgi:hypothetical protein